MRTARTSRHSDPQHMPGPGTHWLQRCLVSPTRPRRRAARSFRSSTRSWRWGSSASSFLCGDQGAGARQGDSTPGPYGLGKRRTGEEMHMTKATVAAVQAASSWSERAQSTRSRSLSRRLQPTEPMSLRSRRCSYPERRCGCTARTITGTTRGTRCSSTKRSLSRARRRSASARPLAKPRSTS